MYDNVDFILNKDTAPGTAFLDDVPQYLTSVTNEGANEYGRWLSGYLDNLNISISDRYVKIYNSSICKYYLGNNFQTLTRIDTQNVIEQISDILHLPMNKARIARIDFATNLSLDYRVEIYYPYLGDTRYYSRLEQANGLYYKNNIRQLVFYGKVHEQKVKKQPIPMEYRNSNLLRYEIRFLRRLPYQFNETYLTAELLYDEIFYKHLVNRWADEYYNIPKIKLKILNIEPTGSKIALTESLAQMTIQKYGQARILKMIDEWQKMGRIEKKQAYDLRKCIKKQSVSSSREKNNELIEELSRKIEAISMSC